MQTVPLTDSLSGRTLILQIRQLLTERGVQGFREPPPEPVGCCGRGCNGCVWEGYFNALSYWRDEAVLLSSE